MATGVAVREVYASTSVALLGALSLVVPSGYSVGAGLLLLGGFSVLGSWRKLSFSRHDWSIVAVIVAYAAIGMLQHTLHDLPASESDLLSRWLFAALALPFVMLYPPRLAALWGGLAVGGVATGAWSTWLRIAEDAERVHGFTHPIQYGNLSLFMGVLCLAGLGWAGGQKHRLYWMAALIAGAAGGLAGSLLSGSRGGWIVLPALLLVILAGYWQLVSRRALGLAVVLGVVLTASVIAVPQTGVMTRIDAGVTDIRELVQDNHTSSSLGARLEMWRGAWMLIPQHPILGIGPEGYLEQRDALIARGVVDPVVGRFSHVHNDYLDVWMKRGLVGLLALLALYLVPLYLFVRRIASRDRRVRSLGIAGTLLSVSWLGFSLTQTFLAHNSGVMMHAFWLIVLWACLRSQERALAHEPMSDPVLMD